MATVVGRGIFTVNWWFTNGVAIYQRGAGRMNFIIPLVVVLVFPFMLPFIALIVLVAVLNKAKPKPAENFGDIQDD